MNDTTQRTFTAGELLAGKYRVERVIGEGGMGVVLAARHEALATNVAIKLLRASALEHTDVVGRFMREARAAVSLRSEHVARVFDVGNLDDGRPYIVMERLEGQDLGDVIDHGPPLPIPDAIDYVMQACEAIAEAHAAGIVHRDLKPKNLFLTRAVHGRPLVKVLDFGISKIEAHAGPQEMQLTRTTEVIGSPSYMSPEQLRSSRNVDARTDIWALGVILYELLTKRLPFYAETVTELVLVVVTDKEPPVRALRPDCPEGLEAIVARCLQKQPEHRFQSVVELVQALEPFAQGVQATITERVRAVASNRGLPPAPSSSALPPAATAPIPSPSSRVNVHGGTSVAWGETHSVVGPAPHLAPPAPPSRAGLVAGLVVGGLLLASTTAGGA
ncbi:MAG: serine/threonine protein kinase, partial [Labilithrix sp.]|nr:serine/threonine protein kinase [Labilithrix sp.]